jgi:hypothetical protein
MSIIHTDGFDYYTNNTQNNTIYRPGAYTNNTVEGAFSYGRAADLRGENVYIYDHDDISTIIVGAHINFNGNNTNNKFLIFWDVSTEQLAFTVNALGRINVYRGATLLGTSPEIITNAWLWFSIKVNFAASGSVSIKVNEHEILNLTGVDTTNTANNYCNATGIGSAMSSYSAFWDNYYILDTTGPTYNDHIVEHRIKTIYPTADGTHTDFSASAGNRWACIDENTPNDSTDYIQSNTTNHIYTMAAQTTGVVGSVSHVKISAWAIKSDVGLRELAMVNRIGSTNYVGTPIPITPGWRYHSQTYPLNPATSNPWTKAVVDAAQFGIKLVT